MAADEKWYFTKEQLANTPSRKCGIDADKELSYRQQAANFIQDMGQRLSVTQLCINTAIVYMHRFYVFHSLSQFHRNAIATAALFLAAKVEEQPRKLEHVIKVAHVCLHKDQPPPDVRSEQYLEQAQDVVFNENVLLQTLGFDVAIDHPHTHVVRCCHLVRASKDLAQASYFMASNSLHMTTMCLQYKPTVVACFCIHLACKWSNWEIPQSNEGKHWFWYVDRSVTSEMLQQLTAEFLHIFDNCPSRLKRRIKSISAKQSPSLNHPSLPNSPFDTEPRQVSPAADGGPTFQSSRPFPLEESKKPSGQSSSSSTTTSATPSASSRPPVDYREYREKKERERLEREKAAAGGSTGASNSVQTSEGQGLPKQSTSSHHSSSHHAKQQQQGSTGTSTSKQHPGVPGSKPVSHHNHHHGAHRGDSKPSGQQPTGSQRHSVASASGQSGRPSRGGPRDYNASVTSNAAGYQQTHQTKDATSQGTSEAATGTELNPSGFEEPPLHVSEKSSNNRSVESKHEKSQRSGSGGGYDPRHKALDGKEAEQKGGAYAKYQQDQRGRKIIDSVEQRSEEVRKLIEKPLPLPKATARPDATSQKDDYVAYMMKQQAHNAKYGQPQQQQTSSEKPGPLLATPSLATRNPPDYVAGSTRDKTAMAKNSSQQTHVQVNASTVKKFDNKSNVKNGNSQLISGEQQETTKHEKRSRHQPEDERLQGNAIGQQQASNVQHTGQPVKQHKSLFSPEKTTNQRESHPRISSRSSRQKTPPSTGSVTSATTTTTTISSKAHDRVPDQSGNLDHFTSLDSSQSNNQNVIQHQQQQQQQQQQHHHHHHHHHQQQQHHSQTQNTQESSSIKATTSHTKRHRTSSIADTTKQQQTIKAEHQIKTETGQMKIEKLDTSTRITEQPIKIEPLIKHEPDDNRETYENMKMLGRVPELLQPIRENPNSSNGRGGNSNTMITAPCSLANDLKLPELIKPFEPEPPVRQIALTNGLESKALHLAKQHEDALRDSQDSGIFSRSSQDYLSPRKSAQSISALLQEPLAPMPSLLQSIDEYDAQRNPASQPPSQPSQEGQNSSQRSSSSSYQYNEAREAPGRETRREVGNADVSAISTQDKDVVISTVDITALAAPPQTLPEATNTRVLNPAQAPSNNPQASLDDSCPTTTSTTTTTAATIPVTATSSSANASAAAATSANARKSGHHKSDKKKKKDKHKHKEKDKEKSRDKKKPKHKDKEKEKHIKITIPKDKLNLTGETAAIQTNANPSQSEEKKSPQAAATGLKIKIPKERLKANNEASSQSLVQAPLKITIRTSVNENSESTVSMSSTSSRKRDRSNMEPPNEPPTKKQYPHHHSQGTSTTSIVPTTTTTTTTTNSGTTNQQQHYHHQALQQGLTSFVQQPGQRPNGRHYTSNNKDKHTSSSSSHHKSTNKLTQQQQQQLLLQHQQQQQLQLQLQMQLQQQHHQHSHPT